MFANYIKIAVRNIIKHKWFTLINVVGLGIGSACCLLILSDIQYELSYDRFHTDSANIYRALVQRSNSETTSNPIELTPAPLAAEMQRHFPEVLAATRFGEDQGLIQYEEKAFDEKGILWADSTFVDVFSFTALQGDVRATLTKPYSVALTESTAKRLFGTVDPMGKVITMNKVTNLQVGAVLKDIPENSNLKFDYLVSLATERAVRKSDVGCGNSYVMFSFPGSKAVQPSPWNTLAGKTYFKLALGIDPTVFQAKLNKWMSAFYLDGHPLALTVQALTDIHLKGQQGGETANPRNDIGYVYFISILAFVILMIACFNYVNLATAKASTRSREVGVRKILGSSRSSLMAQFLVESALITIMALLLSLVVAELLFPAFKALTRAPLSLNLLESRYLQLGLVGIVLFIGAVAGIYPALMLSSCNSQRTIQGLLTTNAKGSGFLRKGLVIFQNVLAISLIFCTVVVFRQLGYISSKDLGVNSRNVILIPMKDRPQTGGLYELQKRIAERTEVSEVTYSDAFMFGQCPGSNACTWEGMAPDQESPNFSFASIGQNFLDFYKVPLIEGRGLSPESPNDYILNESAVKALGWESAVGRGFAASNDKRGTVVGVVRDFNFSPLHLQIEPLAMQLTPTDNWGELAVRLRNDDPTEVVRFIKSIWNDYSSYPLEYEFLDQRMASFYSTEQRLGRIFAYSAGLAIWIACLGLLGLASFEVERRTKDNAVRRVLGASATKIAVSLSSEFLKWVIIGNIIAWPIGYYMMSRWLQDYAYRVTIGVGTFLVVGLLALIVSFVAIGYQAFKAATANPIDSLKYE